MTKLKPLIPVPKVMVPTVAGLFYVAATWVATGEFDREQFGALVLTGGWAAIGWSTPES
jgi:hypothetical protein